MLCDLHRIAEDEDAPDSLIGSSCGLLGDLAQNYPQIFAELLLGQEQMQSLHSLLTRGKTSDCSKTKSVAFWASQQLATACDTLAAAEDSSQVVKKARVGE